MPLWHEAAIQNALLCIVDLLCFVDLSPSLLQTTGKELLDSA